MNDLKNGDLILCIANLSNVTKSDRQIGNIGIIARILKDTDGEYLNSLLAGFYKEHNNKYFLVEFSSTSKEWLIKKEIIKIR